MAYEFDREQHTRPDVVQLYDELIPPHMALYPAAPEGEDITEPFLEQVRELKRVGAHLAIVDGAYDVPHDSHAWYLRDCRRIAAERHFGGAVGELAAAGKTDEAQALVASSDIFLIVTLDADAKVTRLKGNNQAKGGAQRPVYPWQSRANRIGGYMIPDGEGGHRPVLDLIVPEGDDAHSGSIFESHLAFGHTLAKHGLLDSWIFYGEHGKSRDIAQGYTDNDGTVTVIPEHLGYAKDPRTDQEWHSSHLIRLIRGEI